MLQQTMHALARRSTRISFTGCHYCPSICRDPRRNLACLAHANLSSTVKARAKAVPSAHRIPRGVLRKRNGNGFSAESRMRVRSQNGKSNMLPLQGSLKALSKLASRDAAVFAVAISAGFLAHLDPFGNLHWDSMNAVQGLAWAGPIIAVDAALLVPKYTARKVTNVVTTTADDIARDQAAQAKFTAERQALHMSPEEPFALLGESSPGKEISPGIYQKEVTVLQQQAAWRNGLGKWQWDRANKEPRFAIQMPLHTIYSLVSMVASEMLLRAVTLAGLARLLASNKYIAGVEVIQLDGLWTESTRAYWAAVIVMAAWPFIVGIFEHTPCAFTEDNYVVMPDVSRQLRQLPEAERQRIEQKTQSCLQDITYKKNIEQKVSIAADVAQQAVRAFTLGGSYMITSNLLASIVAAAVADFPLQVYLQSHMQDEGRS